MLMVCSFREWIVVTGSRTWTGSWSSVLRCRSSSHNCMSIAFC